MQIILAGDVQIIKNDFDIICAAAAKFLLKISYMLSGFHLCKNQRNETFRKNDTYE